MAKLTKIAQNIFGSAAGASQIGVFGSKFAGAQATTTDPATAQSLSNWLTGWLGAAIGGNSPAIEDMNAVHFVSTYQLAYLMQAGVAEWDAVTPYYIGSLVNVSGVLYRSLIDNNVGQATTDATKWKLYSTDPAGTGKDFYGSTLPDGYVWASGKTIGSAASGGTERANADTLDLYTLLWNSFSNTLLPIQDSTGVATSRGVSAAADFAANKRLPVIDKRGRVSVAKDDLGGTAANRVTTAGSGVDGLTLGASGGEQSHLLTTPEMPAHNHQYNSYSSTISVASGGNTGILVTPNPDVTTSTGGGTAHNNMQPTIICNYILKL